MRKPHSTCLGVHMALGFIPDHARFLLCRVPSVLQLSGFQPFVLRADNLDLSQFQAWQGIRIGEHLTQYISCNTYTEYPVGSEYNINNNGVKIPGAVMMELHAVELPGGPDCPGLDSQPRQISSLQGTFRIAISGFQRFVLRADGLGLSWFQAWQGIRIGEHLTQYISCNAYIHSWFQAWQGDQDRGTPHVVHMHK